MGVSPWKAVSGNSFADTKADSIARAIVVKIAEAAEAALHAEVVSLAARLKSDASSTFVVEGAVISKKTMKITLKSDGTSLKVWTVLSYAAQSLDFAAMDLSVQISRGLLTPTLAQRAVAFPGLPTAPYLLTLNNLLKLHATGPKGSLPLLHIRPQEAIVILVTTETALANYKPPAAVQFVASYKTGPTFFTKERATHASVQGAKAVFGCNSLKDISSKLPQKWAQATTSLVPRMPVPTLIAAASFDTLRVWFATPQELNRAITTKIPGLAFLDMNARSFPSVLVPTKQALIPCRPRPTVSANVKRNAMKTLMTPTTSALTCPPAISPQPRLRLLLAPHLLLPKPLQLAPPPIAQILPPMLLLQSLHQRSPMCKWILLPPARNAISVTWNNRFRSSLTCLPPTSELIPSWPQVATVVNFLFPPPPPMLLARYAPFLQCLTIK